MSLKSPNILTSEIHRRNSNDYVIVYSLIFDNLTIYISVVITDYFEIPREIIEYLQKVNFTGQL